MSHFSRALDQAKIGLMTHGSAFIITVALNLKHEEDDKIRTAKTNGTSILYNPKFFLELSKEQRVSLLAHETWHVALLHMFRCKGKRHEKYNRAGDYVINQLIRDAKGAAIPGWLQDDKYRGMSTNQIYDLLEDEPEEDSPDDLEYGGPKTQNDIEQVIIKAQLSSEIHGGAPGDIPEEITRRIDKLLNPKLPWETLLHRFITDQDKNDYSWSRPNKRFMPDFYLPSQYSEKLSHLVFAIDTSGSVSKKDMDKMLSEIKYIHEVMSPDRMTILDCDTKIHNIHEVTSSDEITNLKFSGGGGTKCTPVIKYCEEHSITALVYFTDLQMSEYPHPINFPLLWIVYNNPKRTKVNIGEITHYDIKGTI